MICAEFGPDNHMCRRTFLLTICAELVTAMLTIIMRRALITRPALIQFPGWEARFIRCKNLALYIRDCESLCLSDDTLKAVGPLELSGVYARGSKISHTG